VAAGIYGAGIALRLALYRWGLIPVRRLPLRVISLGNLVVGGTGKTPHTALIADHFTQRGKQVVILSRGYGGEKSNSGAVISSPEKIIGTLQDGGEEPYWLAEHLPGVAVVIGKNRYRSGLLARERWGAELAILDDGFQHLGLERGVNILLLSASQPFGPGGLLPRGTLREPREQIKRADVVLITHTEMIADKEQVALKGQVSALHPGRPVYYSRHVPREVWSYPAGESRPWSELKGRRVLAFCGLGQPESFQHSLKTLGVELAGLRLFRDHQVYREKEKQHLREEAAALQAALLTTEKDALKLGVWPAGGPELLVLRIRVEIPDPNFWDELENRIYKK
jgi:tetraacyldisaccharide 4'-kinase